MSGLSAPAASIDGEALRHRQQVLRQAAAALDRIRSGRIDDGLAQYRKLLLSEEGSLLPAALHARMLDQAGMPDAAAALMSLGRRCGANLSLRGALSDADTDEVIEEFQSLFARGEATARMIARYLAMLSLRGRAAEMAALAAASLVHSCDISLPANDRPAVDPVAVTQAVLARTGPQTWCERTHSTVLNHRVNGIHLIDDPALVDLVSAMKTEALRYRDQVRAVLHQALRWVPQRLEPEGWALVSYQDGFASSHIHPRGWITSVFYPTATGDNQGTLHIGRPHFLPGEAPGWPEVTIVPEVGRMVLFPSWLSHWTLPLRDPGLRIAVAIDFVDPRGEQ